jgi:hypothetical protein
MRFEIVILSINTVNAKNIRCVFGINYILNNAKKGSSIIGDEKEQIFN